MCTKFENQSKDEQLKTISAMLDKYLSTSSDDEKMELMMNIMSKVMGSGIPMMKKMYQTMCASMCGSNTKDMNTKNSDSTSSTRKRNDDFGNSEIKNLFDDWVNQVEEEIKSYMKANSNASPQEIAKHLKMSEESVNYFIKNLYK